MNDPFSAIDPERQKRILDAAYQEFARHGYKRASTNRIIKEAGIGKGPLFSYFGSKTGLFEYLIMHATNFVSGYLAEIDMPENDTDFIDKFRVASKLKLAAYLKEPYIFEFISWLYLHQKDIHEVNGIKKFIDYFEQMKNNFFVHLYENQHLSKFRSDIPLDKLIQYIGWLMDGYTQALINSIKAYPSLSDIDLNPYWQKFDEYIDDLKKLFYQ